MAGPEVTACCRAANLDIRSAKPSSAPNRIATASAPASAKARTRSMISPSSNGTGKIKKGDLLERAQTFVEDA
ncbi:hypothetical protein A8926_3500 [Saccharopolyspora spinosa]|uniref:Uncharacterized protein n=1 Tax=Saccharopolyspora spinosa TaxID=60894 RepID=A0A2N3XYM1_SACSN|nr:hypothetical protein A8926_3500 [Saccharopolyspora spinosa]